MNMVLAVMYREYRIRTTSMTWLFFDFIVPLAYLLLFGIGLDRAMPGGVHIDGETVSYASFFLPGVLAMSCFGIAINTSYGFFVDRDNGIFYEFLTYPMTRGQFLIGKILFNCILSAVQSLATILLGAALLGIPLGPGRLALVLPIIVAGTAAWFFFLTPFALRIRRNDVFNTVINLAYFVLMFVSSLFYPLDALPSWLQGAALVNPLTWHTDLIRHGMIGVGSAATTSLEAVGLLLFLALSFIFAVRTLRDAVVA